MVMSAAGKFGRRRYRMMPEQETEFLSVAEWRDRAHAYRERLLPWVQGFRARRARGETHPVVDFLFTYYSYRPGQLLRWSPGFGVDLEDPGGGQFAAARGFTHRGGRSALELEAMPRRQRGLVRWIGELMQRCADRPGRFGCFGLHEWAMVYRLGEGDIRHASFPLRLTPAEIAEVVESATLCCTHYDAFRFFTPDARLLNSLRPGMDDRLELEQPGCLHTNMDLYKWSYKLAPWIPSELMADAFELAARIRELDMRASPYDLGDLGYPPVAIETPEGRVEYEREQRAFAAAAAPLRERLAICCRQLQAGLRSTQPGRRR